jgi:glutamate-1-semialdehyde 2,1-aminomutase
LVAGLGAAAAGVGALLRERFGLPHWQVATTATDANRFALRVARAVTGRPRILVFNGCYHGTVEETFLRLAGGAPVLRPGVLGQAVDLSATTTRIVEFNDLPALEAALAHGDVACVITEPVLTNSAMVLPEPGFHDGLRRLTREAGTLLLIDETHTISTGPGGYTARYGLDPDLFVCGKPIAGGIPASVWGFSDAVAAALDAARLASPGFSGMGTTLSANPLALAAMRATLSEVMTDAAYEHMLRLAGVLEAGLGGVVSAAGLPWHIVRVGARVELVLAPRPLRNGSEAEAAHIPRIERAIHLGLLNRGALIAPFHNMMLVSPATSDADVATLVAAFAAVVAGLTAA